MESIGYNPHYVSSTFWANDGRNDPEQVGLVEYFPMQLNFQTDFHVYALEWTCNTLSVYIDDALIIQTPVSDAPFMKDNMGAFTQDWLQYYLIMNVAIGGSMFGPDDIPSKPKLQSDSKDWGQMEIDYVRVYGPNSVVCTPVPTATSSKTRTSSKTTFTSTTTTSTSSRYLLYNFFMISF